MCANGWEAKVLKHSGPTQPLCFANPGVTTLAGPLRSLSHLPSFPLTEGTQA